MQDLEMQQVFTLRCRNYHWGRRAWRYRQRVRLGRCCLVRKNGKFERWQPNPRRQEAEREGHRSGWRKG